MIQSRSIIAVNTLNALLILWLNLTSSVGSQIASFRVTCQDELPRQSIHSFSQIIDRRFLSWNLIHIGHVEVLFPADNGIIGSAEGQDIAIRLDFENHSCKLLLNIRVNIIDIAHELNIFEAG